MTVSDLTGRALGGVLGVVSRVRPADKPMHPRGVVLTGRLRRWGATSDAPTGAAFLDEAGEDDVLVRFSRSVGLPAPLPDVDGLAIRVPLDGADGAEGAGGAEGVERPYADVLMSGAGRGRWSRYVLRPSLREQDGFLSTLAPFRSPTGPVLLGARPHDETVWRLSWARPRSRWTAFADLHLEPDPGRDLSMSFDATVRGPSGLDVYDLHRRLRAPAYRAARRARGAD